MVSFKPYVGSAVIPSWLSLLKSHFLSGLCLVWVFLAVWSPSIITWAWHHWHPMQVVVPPLEDMMSDIWAMYYIKSPGRKVLPLSSCQQVHLNLDGTSTSHGPHCLSLFTHHTHLCESSYMGSCLSGWRRSWGRCRISSCTFYGRAYTCILLACLTFIPIFKHTASYSLRE